MSTDQQQRAQSLLRCQQSAEELAESEAFCRSVINSSPDCIKVLDLEGNLLSMLSGQDLLGIEDITPFLNKSWLKFWDGGDRLAAQAALQAAIAGGTGQFVGFFRTFHGLNKWWDVVVSPIVGADGRVTRLLTVSRDVTDRYKAQEDLAQRTVQFETLFNAAPMGIFLLTDDLCISQANPVARKVWPSSPELIGRNFEELMRSLWPAVMADNIIEKYRHTLATGESYKATDIADQRIDHGGYEYYEWQINRMALSNGRYGVVCYFRDILERALAQQAILESEDRYRNLFNAMDQGFCVIEVLFDAHEKATDYRFIEVNPAFAPLTGLHEATGKRMREIAPNLDQEWFEIYGEVALTGQAKHFVNQAHALGARWFDVYACRLGGPQSRKVALLFSNITDRVNTDKALRHSEERFRAFITASADVMYRMSPDWHEMQQLQGKNFIVDTTVANADWLTQYIEPQDQPEVMAAVQQAIQTKSLYELEHRVRRIDGSVGWTLSRAVPLLDQAGEITEWFGTASDVTEHKRAEQDLRQSEARFRALFDWGPLAMYTVNASGVIEEFNRNAVALWGCEPQLGDTSERYCGAYKLHYPDGTALQHDQTPVAAVLSGQTPAARDVEVIVERPDGSKITVIANIVPLKNNQAEVTGAIICLYDITERSRMEYQTSEHAQTLLTLDRRKDEFLAMLNHELRNPIAAIFNAVQLLETVKNEAPAQLQGRRIIARQAGQLKHLVDDLLEVSRIKTGTIHLQKEPVSVHSIVAHAVESTEFFIKQRHHVLTVALPPEPLFLYGDVARLEQVVVNLLTNAAKYTNEGGCIWLSVEKQATLEASAVPLIVLKVRDNGIGITPELLPRIFELFTQADRTLDRAQGGLGIGLSLVQQLVALHGGTIQVKSVVGQGSEFVVQLPVLPQALPALPVLPAADILEPQSSTTSCRVLVVDDNQDAAQSLAMLLEMMGHQVSLAYDGPSAVQAALDFQPDVVLLDIGLPKLNGYEVAQKIRQQDTLKNTVLVAVTGYGQKEDRKRSQAAGFDHHLVKPANFDEIETILAGVRPPVSKSV